MFFNLERKAMSTITIWFRPIDSTGALKVDVQNVNPEFLVSLAQYVWDNLSENFYMVSARP
jgi:hypothetical protein